MIKTKTIVNYFFKMSILNTLTAIIFLFPILIPQLAFPILITEWPGIYMIIGYFAFVISAVIGFAIWSFIYYLLESLYKIENINTNISYAQIILSEIGALLTCIFMYWGGYVGAAAAYSGMSEFVVGTIMEFATIPSGLGIVLILFGNSFGIINIIISLRK